MKPGRVYGDVETFTRLPGRDPLKDFGAYRYSVDTTTGFNSAVLGWQGAGLLTYEYNQVQGADSIFAQHLRALLNNPDLKFVFHYALFELAMIKNKLGIVIPPSRVIDTYAKLGYYGYPRGLDEGAKAVGSPILKDLVKKGTMQELAKGKWTPEQKPQEFKDLYEYNRIDVLATIEIDMRLPDLPPDVQRLWELDVEINMRGVPVDVRAIENALALKEKLRLEADQRMQELTAGFVQTVGQVEKIQEFAKAWGVDMVDCTADTIRRTLAEPIPSVVRAVLELRQEAGLTSLGKYEQMQQRQVGGRLYHEFNTYGCFTGRPKGGGVQVLNLARSTKADWYAKYISEAPEFIPIVFNKPLTCLKEGIRGVIKASEGKVLVGGDLGQIEARATFWAAGEPKLHELFGPGKDPYCVYGKMQWGREITKDDLIERTAAKATVLGMGFGGGIGAQQRGAEQYGTNLDVLADLLIPTATLQELETAEYCYQYYLKSKPLKPLNERQGYAADILKQRFRKDFARIPAYWEELMNAFLYGGQAGPVFFEVKPSGLRILTLPSGRQLFYHDVRIKDYDPTDDEEDSKSRITYQARDKKFRTKVWKGLLMENIAQAINHDISTWYMLQANNNIAPVVHQCYDEFTLEVDKRYEDWAREQLEKLTKTQPAWSAGLPIIFDVWSGERYG
jgi:DNA polymerase